MHRYNPVVQLAGLMVLLVTSACGMEGPLITQELPDMLTVTYGDTVTLTCSVSSSTPVNISWNASVIGDLPKPFSVPDGNDTDSTLTLINVGVSDEGSYSCVATNQDGSDVSTVDITVDVPAPTISVSPNTSSVAYNSTITLTCESTSFAETTITWSTNAVDNDLPVASLAEESAVHTSTLILPQVTTDSNGDYTCTVTNLNSSVTDVSAVNVFVPLPEVTISPISPVSPPSTATLTCNIFSFTIPTVTWSTTAVDQTLPSPSLQPESADGVYTSVITIDSVLPYNGGSYTCSVDNNGGTANDTGVLEITIIAPTVTPFINGDMINQYTVEYNQSLELECQVVSFVDATIEWTDPNGAVVPNEVSTYDDVSQHTSTISFSQATLSNRGIYVCNATNSAGSNTTNFDIEVSVPAPTINVSPDTTSVAYNSTITLTCESTSFAETNVTWSTDAVDNDLLVASLAEESAVHTSTLILPQVTTDSSGDYTCTVTNLGSSVTDVSTVIVFVPAPTISVSPDTTSVAYNSTITLTCESTSFAETNITWSTNAVDNDLPVASLTEESAVHTSTLILPQVTTDSSGSYTCTVTNLNSSVTDVSAVNVFVPPPEVTISPISPVSPPSNATLTCNIFSFTIPTVTWSTTAVDQTLPSPSLPTESGDGVYTSVLTIDSVLPDNGGSYTCSVTNNGGTTSDTGVLEIIIIAPIITAFINDDMINQFTVEYNQLLELECQVVSFVDTTIEWTDPNGVVIPNTFSTYDGVSQHTSTISFSQATLSNRGTYVCNATNSAGSNTANFDIEVFVPPPSVTPLPGRNVTVGHTVTFICSGTGFGLSYSWTFLPKLLQCYNGTNCILGENTPNLTIVDIPVRFNTTVMCTVTDVDNQMASESFMLLVNGLELVSQNSSSLYNPIVRLENQTFYFLCEFAYPIDILGTVNIQWIAEGRVVINSSTLFYQNVDNGKGEIQSFLTFDPLNVFIDIHNPPQPFRRVYNCEGVIDNRYDNVVKSDGIHLDVEFTPYFDIFTQTHPMNPTRINLGSTKLISCYAIGNPAPNTTFEDITNGNVIELKAHGPTNSQVDYTINITEVSDLMYQCAATNIHGTRVYGFRVIIQDRPDQINSREIIVTQLSLFDTHITWNMPDDNLNEIDGYNISYSDVRGLVLPTTIDSVTTSVDIDNLGINTNYSLSISATNGVGVSEGSSPIIFSGVTSEIASLTDVGIPRVFVTSSSIFVQWLYPDLLVNPIRSTKTADVKHILITLSSKDDDNKITVPYHSSMTSYNITESILPDTTYDVSINIIYTTPANLNGVVWKFVRQTLPAGNVPAVLPVIDESALTGPNPTIVLSWTPLNQEDGVEFLTAYVVRITTAILPQVSRSKRQIPPVTTEDIMVDRSQSSFEYDADPFTLYTAQVLADLNLGGSVSRRAITSPSTAESSESVPTAPRDLTVTDSDFTSISLSWSIPDPPNGFIIEYNVYIDQATSPTTTDTTSIVNNGLTGGQNYTFRVTARTSAGEGASANIAMTTPAGVYPLTTLSITKGNVDLTINLTVPAFSTRHGPLSYYQVIVVTGDTPITNITNNDLYPNGDPKWRDLGYYVAAIIPATEDNRTIVIGDKTYTSLGGVDYFNAILEEDVSYSVFIRLYSAATNPVVPYRDSSKTVVTIEFPSTPFPLVAVVIPIIIFFVLLVIVIVVVILFIILLYLRRSPKHTETLYLDEVKTMGVKPINLDSVSPPPRNNSTNSRNNMEMKKSKAFAPSLAVQTPEVFTSIGQPTILLCEASGTPSPEVLWSKDGRTLQGPEYKVLADGSLYILETNLKDDGQYVVSAYNDGGTVEEGVKVVVIAPLPPESDPSHPPQTVSEFIERMALLHSAMDEQLEDEYHDIELEWNITVYNAKLPMNHNKNRYVNIIPYDHSRVYLGLQEGSDYINGSFVDGFNEQNAYIATQGPIPSTFGDFWRMAWEFDVPTIIMVTNLKEDEKIKCHQYWPSYGASNYGDLQVTLKEVENIVDYSIRTFQIQLIQGGPAKEIRQFHFQVWPDHGVPQYATALLGFRKRIKKYHPINRGPLIVHCSAGVGRTGTFICIDTMMNMIEAEGKVDIFNFVRHMRFRRNYMVQTSTQYEFIHEALLETIMCGDTSLPVKSLTQRVMELNQVDPVSGKSGFLTQFQTLDSSCPNDEEFDCSVAQLPDNLAKTRCTKHLLPTDSRVVLSTKKYDSDYICASFIDGYRQRQCFITTQGPMKNTAGDFWRMVWEYKTSAIVMLTQLEENGIEQCVQYWPSTGQEIWGTFVVSMAQEERVLPEYTVRKFNIRHIDNSEEVRTVTQFHYTNWSHDCCPSNGSSLNDMIGEVLRVQRKSGNNPITVHCSDGLGRTGTFCGTFTILERVKAEQVVDVFSTVKSLRIQRPGLLGSLDQYEFIHKVVLEFLTTFDNYDNFK